MPTAPTTPAANAEDSPYWKTVYIGHAYSVSYVMQGKSAGETAYTWVRQQLDSLDGHSGDYKPERVQSFLGGAFLRMYLDHKVDPSIVEEAGQEIAASKEFAALTEEVTSHLQRLANRTSRPLDDVAVKNAANQYLRGKQKHQGIKFRETLNAVIGGVGGIEVVDATRSPARARDARGKVAREHVLRVKISDVYDFQNKRHGEYQRYREHLATLLRANRYSEFNLEYFGEVNPLASQRKAHLDLAGTFASFMYAVECKGWTPGGLAWDVTVPMTVEFTDVERR